MVAFFFSRTVDGEKYLEILGDKLMLELYLLGER